MKTLRFTKLVTVTLIATAAIAALVISCATVERVMVAPPMIPGAKYVGMENCAPCHEKIVRDFKLTQHSRLVIRTPEGDEAEGLGCEGCHGPGSLHVDEGGGRGVGIVNPKKSADACFQCHLDKRAEFSLQYRHPVKEGRMTCIDCHNPHGQDVTKPKGLFVSRVNDNCAQCHREQSRPHVFEHEALREGCTSCHNVHGSINPKMLTERNNTLCLKCHAQVAAPQPAPANSVFIGSFPHGGVPPEALRQGSCFSAGCHTAVHGSDVNSHLRY